MSDLTKQLEQWLPWQRTAFITCLTERMYPNYVLFSELTQWGDATVLRRVLDKSWELLKQGKSTFSGWESWHDKIEENTPDQKDFDMFGVFAAIDTMVCVSLLLDSYKDEHANLAISASELSFDLVQFYIDATTDTEMSDDEFEIFISKHDLIIEESDFQSSLAEALASCEYPNQVNWAEVMTLSKQDGVSNIGIALEEGVEVDA